MTTTPPMHERDSLPPRYQILGEIGRGSFGRVLRARDAVTGRIVAIKLACAADAAGMLEEARACSAVEHPNVAALLDCGLTATGQTFLVFPYIDGTTLRTVIDTDGAIAEETALRWMCQVLDALAAAHARGIVHRDVKPENIMITGTGGARNAVLLDFGLAAHGSAPDRRELVGTPRYAAPEQLRAEAVTPAADVYAWALTLLECLAGRGIVATADAREAIAEQLSQAPVAVPEELRRLPLVRLLEPALHKRAGSRPQNAGQLLAFLARAVPFLDSFASAGEAVVEYTRSWRDVVVVSARLVEPDAAHRREELALAADTARRCGGTIASAGGERLIVVFGLIAGDDAALDEAAGEAAVELAAALADRPLLASSPHVGWHVGVSRGRVELPLPTLGSVLDVAGDPAASAAKLDEAASCGRVLIDGAVHAAVAHRWWCTRSGSRASTPAFQLRRRLAADHAVVPAAPLIGRRDPLRRIEQAWSAVGAGTPRALLLTGAPGMGKSRLLREARALVADAADWLEMRCSLDRQTAPLQPFLELLQMLGGDAAVLAHRYELAAEVAVPVLATLLGREIPPGFVLPPVTAERHRELVQETVLSLLVAMASDGPVVLALEDLQWADSTSLELIDALMQRLGAGAEPLPFLLLMTSRPAASVRTRDGAERIEIAPLQAEEAAALVESALGSGRRGDAAVSAIVEASGGVPLFLERSVRLLLQHGSEEGAHIPSSLEAVLSEQIALLGPQAGALARAGAAIGHDFPLAIAAACAGLRPAAATAAIEELTAAGIVVASESGWMFAHALLRDAAYASIEASARRGLHLAIAGRLEREQPELALRRPSLLAGHFELGGKAEAAADLWHRSGVQALGGAAYAEALEDLERALRLLDAQPPSSETTLRTLGVTTAIGSVHISTKGFGAPEARAAFERARRLCESAGREVPLEVLGGIFGAALVTADREATESILPIFRSLSARTDSPMSAFAGHQVLAVHAWWSARIEQAWEHARTAIELYRREAVRGVAWEFGFGIHCYAYGMMSRYHLGDAAGAEALRRELLERAESNANPLCMAVALGWSMTLAHDLERPDEVMALTTRLARLAEEQHMHVWSAFAAIGRGSALAATGRTAEAVTAIEQGLGFLESVGFRCSRVYYLAYLAEAHITGGDPAAALAAIDEGLQWCGRLWTRVNEAELLRLRGAVESRRGAAAEAAATMSKARAVASAAGSRALIARIERDEAAFPHLSGAAPR